MNRRLEFADSRRSDLAIAHPSIISFSKCPNRGTFRSFNLIERQQGGRGIIGRSAGRRAQLRGYTVDPGNNDQSRGKAQIAAPLRQRRFSGSIGSVREVPEIPRSGRRSQRSISRSSSSAVAAGRSDRAGTAMLLRRCTFSRFRSTR
jgi:hypothetical protein